MVRLNRAESAVTNPWIPQDTEETQSSWGKSETFWGGTTDSMYSISRVSSYVCISIGDIQGRAPYLSYTVFGAPFTEGHGENFSPDEKVERDRFDER